jgi:hypothetical protein
MCAKQKLRKFNTVKPEHNSWQRCYKCVGHDNGCPWERTDVDRQFCSFYIKKNSPNRDKWQCPPEGNAVIIDHRMKMQEGKR